MSASHSEPMGARNWEPDFNMTTTERQTHDSIKRKLEGNLRATRSIKAWMAAEVSHKGPQSFPQLCCCVRERIADMPLSLIHDTLNTMLFEGFITITPEGKYTTI